MPYSCGTQPERLPIMAGTVLIQNLGTDTIFLGDSPSSLRSYGAPVAPSDNLVYDLSSQRYIAANTGTQTYSILAGGQSSLPGGATIANGVAANIVASPLAANIASATAAQLVDSTLSSQIAAQILNAGTRVIDQPVTFSWGPLNHGGSTVIYDMLDAQSFTIAWNWQNTNAANTSKFGQITLTWFDTSAGIHTTGTDVYEIGGDLNNAATINTYETGYINGPCRGGGLKITFTGTVAPAVASYINASGTLIKSYRLVPVARWTTDAAADRVLINNRQLAVPANGVSQFLLCSPYDGLIEIKAWCASTSTNNTHVRMGIGSDTFYDPSVQFDVMFFPSNNFGAYVARQVSAASRRPIWLQFFNGETAARDFHVTVACCTFA